MLILECQAIQMKASEHYFLEVLCIMWNKVTNWIKTILMCDQLNESSWAILSCGTVYSAVWCDSNFFKSMDEKTAVWQFNQMAFGIILAN